MDAKRCFFNNYVKYICSAYHMVPGLHFQNFWHEPCIPCSSLVNINKIEISWEGNYKNLQKKIILKNHQKKSVIPYTILTGFTFIANFILCWLYL